MFSKRSVRRSVCVLEKKLSLGDSKTSYQRLAIVEDYKITAQTQRGCIAMYVGEEHKRDNVLVKYLSLPKFKELTKQSEDGDLDFKIDGPIMLGCTTRTFDQLLMKLAKEH